ncbi:CpaD family pilus assembly protein [Sphingomonas rhizophila]|uniref:CpaD family pilus assembly protein n=1 Tax=Sphingomonas rhizophila TaxID=2071607 RepID=A0A7G9SE21_9SPHN|nr:CpaD family pilus assembly protein [Sphingomonas rhizophila]QNN66096.1 CpaD family pilus assembly protein [Sphingomonas rhizophila]
MSRTLALLTAVAALSGCVTGGNDDHPSRGVASVNVPVVSRHDYALDLAAPDGSLSPTEAARLDGWFRSMDLGYGDNVYIDGSYAGMARDDVARIAGNYGLLLNAGAPLTAGQVAPGYVRVVVTRARASVPGCPDWSRSSTPDFGNNQMSNFGCGVNGNLAAMVANPEDLVHGREGSGLGDSRSAVKAIDYYRKTPPTGTTGLKDVTTSKGSK